MGQPAENPVTLQRFDLDPCDATSHRGVPQPGEGPKRIQFLLAAAVSRGHREMHAAFVVDPQSAEFASRGGVW